MLKLHVELEPTNPLLIANYDSTSFAVDGCGGDNVLAKYEASILKNNKSIKSGPSRGKQALPEKSENGLVKYFIKYGLLMSAAGFQADPVYIIADDNLTADEFRVSKIPGLGVGTTIDNVGYVSSTKTRTGNHAYYRWLLQTIVVPYLFKVRTFYELPANS